MIGTLALAGIFPFAGFWSKDEILLHGQTHDLSYSLSFWPSRRWARLFMSAAS